MFRTHNIGWRKLHLLFLNFVQKGRGEKHKTVQIADFPITFVTDCSYHLQIMCNLIEYGRGKLIES